MLTRVIAVHVHLSDVGVVEFGKLQINDYQAAQTPVKEQQIHPKPGLANTQPSLTADKCEIAPEFKQEVFESVNQCVL
ncbi:hypothetical protein AWB68_08046 [Caballeronia choica]|uniref:Uncharacterized protein n=1 Tax=Caballeronia choica TaxID=326476 RepID=A0A158KZB4_9BURK|nr:hypothetical protein AWB68_08046 [Caballeronia choica]